MRMIVPGPTDRLLDRAKFIDLRVNPREGLQRHTLTLLRRQRRQAPRRLAPGIGGQENAGPFRYSRVTGGRIVRGVVGNAGGQVGIGPAAVNPLVRFPETASGL